MPAFNFLRADSSRLRAYAFALFILAQCAVLSSAASIRGVVTDATGAKVTGASVALVSNGKVIASAVSTADGSFEILTGSSGRFFLVVSAKNFRQLQTPDFYAGQFDSIERNVVLEPAWVRESIVVTATGTPTPQPQTSAATTVLGPLDLALRDDLVSVLRLMPGTFVVQKGQLGAQTSLFVRGGDSDDNKILLDGVDAGDLGGRFDFGPLSTTAVESAEVYRGPDSNLYGADAESGVVQPDHPSRHHQLSFAALSGRCRQPLHLARGTRACRRAQQARLPGRFQLAANRQRSAHGRVSRGHKRSQPGLGTQRYHADSRHAALRRLRSRRPQRVGLLSRR